MGSRRSAAIVAEVTGESFAAVAFEGGVVIVRWFSHSRPGELPALSEFILGAAATAEGPVDLIAITSATKTLPSARLREELSEFVLATRGAIDTTHVVLVGRSGFWQTIIRSITTGLVTLAGTHGKVTHEASAERAIDALAAKRSLDAARVWRLAETKGLLAFDSRSDAVSNDSQLR